MKVVFIRPLFPVSVCLYDCQRRSSVSHSFVLPFPPSVLFPSPFLFLSLALSLFPSLSLCSPSAGRMDEFILRLDPTLALYWKLRDRCKAHEAREYLHANLNAIRCSTELPDSPDTRTHLAYRFADLYNLSPPTGNELCNVAPCESVDIEGELDAIR